MFGIAAFNAWAVLLTVQALLIVATPFALKLVAETLVGHAFDRRLEQYKSQLEMEA